MPVVRMVQMAVHQIVDMVSMRNSFMTTAWTMNVIRIVTTALMVWGATRWISI